MHILRLSKGVGRPMSVQMVLRVRNTRPRLNTVKSLILDSLGCLCLGFDVVTILSVTLLGWGHSDVCWTLLECLKLGGLMMVHRDVGDLLDLAYDFCLRLRLRHLWHLELRRKPQGSHLPSLLRNWDLVLTLGCFVLHLFSLKGRSVCGISLVVHL